MKKIICLGMILVACLCAGILGGCRSESNSVRDRVFVSIEAEYKEKFLAQEFTIADFEWDNIEKIEYGKWDKDLEPERGYITVCLKEYKEKHVRDAVKHFEKLAFVREVFFETNQSILNPYITRAVTSCSVEIIGIEHSLHGEVVIPSILGGKTVESIGDSAFANQVGITSITIPSSIISIDGSAFLGCSGLTSVIIPNSVATIGTKAFQNCVNLMTVILKPDSQLREIREGAFLGCPYFSGFNGVSGNIIISPYAMQETNDGQLSLEDIEISAGNGYLIKIHDLTEVKVLSTSNKNIRIENIFKYKDGEWAHYSKEFDFNAEALFNFSQECDYYVLLKNGSFVNYEDISFFVTELTQLDCGTQDIKSLNSEESAYYSFIPQYSGNYKFSSSNINKISVYTKGSNTLHFIESSMTSSLNYFLNEGESYYFKITNDTNSVVYFSKQIIILNPLRIVEFGNNAVHNLGDYSFYSFTPKMDGEYHLSSSNTDAIFNIYDFTLNIVAKISDFYILNGSERYCIKQENSSSTILSIELNAQNFVLNNQTQNIQINNLGYANAIIEVSMEGNYNFTANCEIEIYSGNYLSLADNNINDGVMLYAGKYYIHLIGAANATVQLNALFDPEHIYLNNIEVVDATSSKWFTYIPESSSNQLIYTVGSRFIETEIFIYDSNLEFLDSNNSNVGYTNFQYNFIAGQKYYLFIKRLDNNVGLNSFYLMVEDLAVETEYYIYESYNYTPILTLLESGSSVIKFAPNRTANFQVRLGMLVLDKDAFEISVYDITDNIPVDRIGNPTSTIDNIHNIQYITYKLLETHCYYITITANENIAPPYLSVVVPVESVEFTFEGSALNTNGLIQVKQDNSYAIEYEFNENAKWVEPEIIFNEAYGKFSFDTRSIWIEISDNAVVSSDIIQLIIKFDSIVCVLKLRINHKFNLSAEVYVDEITGRIMYEVKEDGHRIMEGLESFLRMEFSIANQTFTLNSYIFDITDFVFNNNIPIETMLYFMNQNGNIFFRTFETVFNYAANYFDTSSN